MSFLKQRLFNQHSNKKDKKQQLIKALKLSYISRRKKVKKTRIASVNVKKKLNKMNINLTQPQLKNTFYLLNLNWLL